MPNPQAHDCPGCILLPLPRRPSRPAALQAVPRAAASAAAALTPEQLSQLLWTGFKFDRRGNGGRGLGSLHLRPSFEQECGRVAGVFAPRLARELGLPATQRIELAQFIGYAPAAH